MHSRKPQAASRKPSAFTLVELLVVISIIVILLALLVGGLERALKAAERSKCSSNQRAIATSAAAYALEYERTFPVATTLAGGTSYGTTALTIRNDNNVTNSTEAQNKAAAVGIGHLVTSARLGGTTKGGEAVHCPSLDTTSGLPLKTGMDEVASSDGITSDANYSGASYWNLPNTIVSGYLYRGKSWALTHSNGTIRTNIAKATFAITSDLVTYIGPAGNRSGRPFHHIDGWMVSFGDGHAEYIKDPEGPLRAPNAWAAGHADPASTAWDGWVERAVAKGRNIHGGAGATANSAEAVGTEDVMKYFGSPTGSGRGSGS